MIYEANGKRFSSFFAAINEADSAKTNVVEVSTGLIRWSPGNVSRKAQRMYEERKAAYEAQERKILP